MFEVITVYKDSAVLSVTERETQCKLLREGNMRLAYDFSLIISLRNPAVWYHETWRTASLTMSSFHCTELSFILIYQSRFWLFFGLLLKIIRNLTLYISSEHCSLNECNYAMLCISSLHIYIVARSQFSLRPFFCVYMAWRSCRLRSYLSGWHLKLLHVLLDPYSSCQISVFCHQILFIL